MVLLLTSVFCHFHSLAEARTYLKEEKDCDICGVEIANGAFQKFHVLALELYYAVKRKTVGI